MRTGRFVGLMAFCLGLLQGIVTLFKLDGLSLTGRRQQTGRRISMVLLLGGTALLILSPLLPLLLLATPALLLAAGILLGLSWWRNVGITPPQAGLPAADEPWTAEPVSFQDVFGAAPGLFLKARAVNSTTRGSGATICWVHGVGDDKSSYKWVMLRALTERGFNVFTFDLPGHGDRAAQPFSLPGGLYTVPAALAYLRQRPDVDPDRIGLVGVSLGGMLSIRALAAGAQVKALALLAVPCSLHLTDALWWKEALSAVSLPTLNIFRDCSPSGLYRTWKPRSNFAPDLETVINAIHPEAFIADVSVPLLFVNGGRDPIAPIEHGRRLFARAKPPKEHDIIRAGSHVSFIFMRETAERVAAWFEKSLQLHIL